MKTKIIALAGMLVLSLLTSVTLAGKAVPVEEKYDDSEFGTVTSGVIKSLRNCPVGTDAFFKNVNPFISGGPGGNPGELQWDGTFVIDGTPVTLSVWWKDDNSFRYEAVGVLVTKIGAEVDSDKLIYEYASPVFKDSGLNVLQEPEVDSAAVNHLDLCLALVDTTPPVIEFVSPEDTDPPAQVLGEVTVTVTVTDPSGVDPQSVTVSVNDETFPMDCEDLSLNQTQYQCSYVWDTEGLSAGLYTITVNATDEAEPNANTATVSITVEVRRLAQCFGILGDEDFPGGEPLDDGYANGCEPTPLMNVQAPPYTEICNPDLAAGPIPEFCYISGELLKPDPSKYASAASTYGGCDACAPDYCGDITQGEYGIPDPRMVCTRNENNECTDEWTPRTPLQPLYVKDVVEGDPDLVLGKFVYGNKGCFAAAQHTRGGTSIVDLYPLWPVDIEDTLDKNEATGAVFVKTDSPAAVLPDGLVAECNVGLLSAQAGYQPIGKTLSVDRLADGAPAVTLALTEFCKNPARKATRDNGYDVASIIETDGSDDLLAFKYQRAQAQFDGLFVALDCAGPTLLTGKFSDVTSPVNQAKAQFDNGTIAALGRAKEDLEAAAFAIKEETTWAMTSENCAGDALSRAYNLSWRMTELMDAQ